MSFIRETHIKPLTGSSEFQFVMDTFCFPFSSRSIKSMEYPQRRAGRLRIFTTLTKEGLRHSHSFSGASRGRLFSGRWETRRQRQDRSALFQAYTRYYASPPRLRILPILLILSPVQVPWAGWCCFWQWFWYCKLYGTRWTCYTKDRTVLHTKCLRKPKRTWCSTLRAQYSRAFIVVVWHAHRSRSKGRIRKQSVVAS